MSESNYTIKEDCYECGKTMYDDEEITEGACEVCYKYFCRECTSRYSGLITPRLREGWDVEIDICAYCKGEGEIK